jgi:hypothetical protein
MLEYWSNVITHIPPNTKKDRKIQRVIEPSNNELVKKDKETELQFFLRNGKYYNNFYKDKPIPIRIIDTLERLLPKEYKLKFNKYKADNNLFNLKINPYDVYDKFKSLKLNSYN